MEEKSGRTWVAALNRATSSDVGKEQQLAIVRRLAPPDATVPPMVNAWIAYLDRSPEAATAAAASALAELDAPLSFHKVALHSKGLPLTRAELEAKAGSAKKATAPRK